MSAPGAGTARSPTEGNRLLTFEAGGELYALPIGGVLEVVDMSPLACVPTLPRSCVGVMNYHGDALPVVERSPLLDLDADELPEPQQVLVIADPRVHTPRFGLPVDRVAGLVDGGDAPTASANLLVQRRPIDGRLVNVLDPSRLVERAREVIEQMASETGQTQGG